MQITKWIVAAILGLAAGSALSGSLGRYLGQFSGNVGTAAMAPLMESQPRWVTIDPRSKSECLAKSTQVINERYVRCRKGWQEYVRYEADGRKVVLSERAIPRW